MDLSKLPKFSKTPGPPEAEAIQAEELPAHAPARQRARDEEEWDREMPSVSLAEVWISIAVGAMLLLMYPTMTKYVSSRLFGTSFVPFTLNGAVVAYPKVYPQFWSDVCVTLFGAVLILEGLTLAFLRNRPLVFIALVLTVLTTGMNVWYVAATVATFGAPIVSLVAIAFGIYIAAYQWRLLKLLNAARG